MKTPRPDAVFTSFEDRVSDAAARPIRVNKKCTDPSRVAVRIERDVLRCPDRVAAKKFFVFAPAAAADDRAVGFDDKISAVADQLSIHAEDGTERRFHLRSGVIARLQRAHRNRDERFQRGNVFVARETQ